MGRIDIVQLSIVEQLDRLVLERPESLVSAVARYIRDAIMHGEYAPGRALPEVWLADQLQTSRGTIREAFRVLADQSLVEIIPHRGSFVAKLTPRKAYEIYTLRAELESYAVRLVMERGGYSSAAMADLRTALERLNVDTTQADQYELAEADMRLHELLSGESEHQVLLETLGSLRLQCGSSSCTRRSWARTSCRSTLPTCACSMWFKTVALRRPSPRPGTTSSRLDGC
jgi:DNA-binding GntR family transcriptional regulator